MKNKFKHVAVLFVVLTVLWLLLSGIYTPFILSLGVISVATVCYFAFRMNVLEHRGSPLYFRPFKLLAYWGWLLIEILKSNWSVTKKVLDPKLPIKPLLKAIPSSQKTEIGQSIYANSITVTPGTIAINIGKNGEMLIHALHEDSIAELETGYMDERVTRLEAEIFPKKINAKSKTEQTIQ